jgi:cathepsin C
MSSATKTKTLVCHKEPNHEEALRHFGFSFKNKVLGEPNFKPEVTWKVSLTNPNIALATDEQGKLHRGTWTSVYDEGFEVDVGNRKFFAFSLFDVGANARSRHRIQETSDCKHTWPGWHRDSKNPDTAKWGCYVGSKISENILEEHKGMLLEAELSATPAPVSLLQGVREPHPAPKMGTTEAPKMGTTEAPKMGTTEANEALHQPEHEMVARINAKASTWKAKAYPQYEHLTRAEFNRMAGFRPAQLPPVGRRLSTEMKLSQEVAHLPDNFDWRNVNGENYIDPVILQKCGSCYAVSTVSMINSRIRIQTKNRVKLDVPYDQVLQCDRYNQGCGGGYPFLVQKYTQEFGLTRSGKCAKPQEELSQLGEEARKLHTPDVRMKDYGYIGGYYGGTTTAQMMQELYKNGPVVVGLNGGYELMFYQAGVFYETGEGSVSAGDRTDALIATKAEMHADAIVPEVERTGIRNDFERVDHAVLLVGWGTDAKTKEKHWILKNSHGAHWGEHGFFRIPLGGDKDGILSLASAGTPVLGGADYFDMLVGEEREEAP